MPTVIFQVFLISSIFHLCNRFFTGFIQTSCFPRILEFENNSAIRIFCFHNNISKAFSCFYIRFHQPVRISSQKVNQKGMIGVLFFCFRRFCIKNTDGITKCPIQIFFYRLRISFFNRSPESCQLPCIAQNRMAEPLLYLKLIHFSDFFIWNNQLIAELFVLRNIKAIKQCSVCPNFKKTTEHAHIQSFSKTPGSGKEIDLSPAFKKLFDQFRFINIVKTKSADFLKIFYNRFFTLCRSS